MYVRNNILATQIKNPFPEQVKGLYTKEAYRKIMDKQLSHTLLNVQPVTRGLKLSFLYSNQAGLPA